jgi:hypothetical protein
VADNVIIQLDLDTVEYTKKLSQVEKDLERVSNSDHEVKIKSSIETKKINDQIVSISETMSKDLTQSFSSFAKSANGDIEKVGETLKKSMSTSMNVDTQQMHSNLESVNDSLEKTRVGVTKVSDSLTAFQKVGIVAFGLYAHKAINAKSVTMDFMTKFAEFRAGFAAGFSSVKDAGKVFSTFTSGIFGLVKSFAILGSSLVFFGQMMRESDSQIVRVAGVISTALGFAMAGLSYSIIIATQKLGEFIFTIGTKGVEAFTAFTKTFSEFEKSNLIFVRTIEGFNQAYGNQIGNLDSWEEKIKSISAATGISAIQLRTAVAELVASGAQFGLNEQQLTKLLNVVVDYSSITGDVNATTVDFVSALQGSSQAVLKYGIKVNEAAIEHELANQGIKRTISSLNDQDMMYLRLGKILKIHSVIEGKAVAVSQTLSGQQQVLNTNLERVNAQIGLGASYIENYNLVALAANTILNNLNDTFLSIFGFVGALGSRILQLIGLMLKLSFTVYGVISVFKLLDIAMKSNLIQTAMGKSIPLLNMSFIDLIRSTGVATVNLSSATGAIKTFGLVAVQSLRNLIAMSLGVEASMLSLGVVFRALAVKGIAIVAVAARGLWAAFAALSTNPFVLVAAGLAAAIYAIYRAMVFLETKTGVVSAAWNVLKGVFAQGKSILAPFTELLNKLGDAAITVAAVFAGYFVDKIAGAFQLLATIIKANPMMFGITGPRIFAKETVEQMAVAEEKIIALRKVLGAAEFDIRKVAGDIAKVKLEKPMGLSPETGEDPKIKKLDTYQQRLFTLGEVNRGFWENQSILTQKFAEDSAIALDSSSKDFQRVAKMIVEKQEELATSSRTMLAEGVADSLSAMGAAFVTAGETGQSGLEALGRGLLGTLGDIFIMMGKQLVAVGLGMSALPQLFGMTGPTAVVAGGAMMVAGGALKAFAGQGASKPQEAAPESGSTKTPSDLTSLQDIQRVEPMTNVTVNVNGVVTDPRGTAKQIADILKGGFKTNGINTRMMTV